MDFLKEVKPAVTVCDKDGNIIYMNSASMTVNGGDLKGKNIITGGCHPEHARIKLEKLMSGHETNAYTIQKGDVRKLIYQTPWYENGEFAGMVELSLPIPEEMPHYVRKVKTGNAND